MSLRRILNFRNTLLFRLTLLYAGIFALSALLIFSIIYWKIHTVAVEEIDEELLQKIHEYSEILGEDGLERLKTEINAKTEFEDPIEEFSRLITSKGNVLFSTDLSSWGSPESYTVPESLRSGQDEHMLYTLMVQGREDKARMISALIGPDTVLQIGETLEDVEDYLRIFRSWFLTLQVIMMIVSVAVGWFMARRALQDVEEVTQTASEISHGAYNKRVQVKDRFEEIKRLGSMFNNMLDRIENLLRSMREVNDNIAHDLRSPLARIRGIAEMSLMNEKIDQAYRDVSASIIEECDSLIDMINTMLEITEIESGMKESNIEEVDIIKLINGAYELFRPVAEGKNIRIILDLPDALYIYSDRRRLERIVSNLLDNAIKYTPEGRTVTISVLKEKGMLQMIFEDTGIGIASGDLPHIFERFYRGDMSRSQDGVGLGLSLAKALTESLSGFISVESTMNKGSIFIVHLPNDRATFTNTSKEFSENYISAERPVR